MPTYIYQCTNKSCEETVEVIHKMTEDNPLKECPRCHYTEFKKVIQASNFHLKGRGWFKDGY